MQLKNKQTRVKFGDLDFYIETSALKKNDKLSFNFYCLYFGIYFALLVIFSWPRPPDTLQSALKLIQRQMNFLGVNPSYSHSLNPCRQKDESSAHRSENRYNDSKLIYFTHSQREICFYGRPEIVR